MSVDWTKADWYALKNKYGKILEHDHFTGIDIETTGLSPEKYAQIIELSAIHLDADNPEDYSKLETLIRPDGSIPKKITTITGITNEMVQNARGLTHVAKELYSFLSDSVIVAHNAMFEKRFLDYYFNYNQLFYTNEYFDTMTAMKLLFPETKGANRLDSFLALFDITNEHWHEANSDSLLTLIAFSKLRKKYFEFFNLEDNIDYDFVENSFNPEIWDLKSARYWEKSYHTKAGKSRLYVRLLDAKNKKVANIYFNYKINEWDYNNQLTRVPLDFSGISELIKEKYNVSDIRELNPHSYDENPDILF